MNKRTRLKIACISLLFFGVTTWIGIFTKMETLAVTALIAISPILTAYIFSEGKRPSKEIKYGDVNNEK